VPTDQIDFGKSAAIYLKINFQLKTPERKNDQLTGLSRKPKTGNTIITVI